MPRTPTLAGITVLLALLGWQWLERTSLEEHRQQQQADLEATRRELREVTRALGAQQSYVDGLCAAGQEVDLRTYPGLGHVDRRSPDVLVRPALLLAAMVLLPLVPLLPRHRHHRAWDARAPWGILPMAYSSLVDIL